MTIGIGVLCSSKPKPHIPRPDTLIMIADTMGSTDFDSTDELHKMYVEQADGLYGVCAGSMDIAAEVWPVILKKIREINARGEAKTHGTLTVAINDAVWGHKKQRFVMDVLPNYSLVAVGMEESQQKKIMDEWERFDAGYQMVIGAFDDSGEALLYLVYQFQSGEPGYPRMVHTWVFPGHVAIGAGSQNATFWLNYRGQELSKSVLQSAYHAYEAKRMAAKAPTVNDATEIVIATKSESFHLTEKHRKDGDFSLDDLEKMFKQYGAQETTALAHS